jgi:hypothetical protein
MRIAPRPLRRIGLHETEYAKSTCGTIRLKLLKIGALILVSVRRIKVAMASDSRDVAAGLPTGDPAGGTAILEREPHDGLSAMRRNDCPRWTGICTQRSSTIILPP